MASSVFNPRALQSPSSGFYWSEVKITKAETPTVRMDCHPILTNQCPNLRHPHHFTPDALPDTTLPIYPGLGQAPNMLACIPVILTQSLVAAMTVWHGMALRF